MKALRLFVLRAIRRLLRDTDILIERQRHGISPTSHRGNGREMEIERFLRRVELHGEAARMYLETHRRRLVRTLSLVPQPDGGRALELGSYVYTAAALDRVLGYRDVQCAYYHSTPSRDQKLLRIEGEADFVCDIEEDFLAGRALGRAGAAHVKEIWPPGPRRRHTGRVCGQERAFWAA